MLYKYYKQLQARDKAFINTSTKSFLKNNDKANTKQLQNNYNIMTQQYKPLHIQYTTISKLQQNKDKTITTYLQCNYQTFT